MPSILPVSPPTSDTASGATPAVARVMLASLRRASTRVMKRKQNRDNLQTARLLSFAVTLQANGGLRCSGAEIVPHRMQSRHGRGRRTRFLMLAKVRDLRAA